MIFIPSSHAGPYHKVQSTNSTDTSFPSRVPTTTEPVASSTRGVIELAPKKGFAPTWLKLLAVGKNADNLTMKLRVIGWRKVITLWVPTTLLEFTATLSSTAPGIAGSDVAATEYFADTMSDPATGKGAIGVDCQPTSPADDTIASYMVDTRGCQKIEVTFNRNSSATECNALYAVV